MKKFATLLLTTGFLLACGLPSAAVCAPPPDPDASIDVTDEQRALADLAAVNAFAQIAQSAINDAAAAYALVDPNDPEALFDAALDLAVASHTFQFLSQASADAAFALDVLATADPADAVAQALVEASLLHADRSLLGAANNLGLLTEDPADPLLFAAMNNPPTPETIKGPDGTDVPAVPKGATGTPTDNKKGLRYTIPAGTKGLDKRVTEVRIMDPTKMYPDGYAVYMNKDGQTVHPRTGRTVKPSDPWAHIPLK